jgi:hypothetical protein
MAWKERERRGNNSCMAGPDLDIPHSWPQLLQAAPYSCHADRPAVFLPHYLCTLLGEFIPTAVSVCVRGGRVGHRYLIWYVECLMRLVLCSAMGMHGAASITTADHKKEEVITIQSVLL